MPDYKVVATYEKEEGFEEGDISTLRFYIQNILETMGVSFGFAPSARLTTVRTPYPKVTAEVQSAQVVESVTYTEKRGKGKKITVKVRRK